MDAAMKSLLPCLLALSIALSAGCATQTSQPPATRQPAQPAATTNSTPGPATPTAVQKPEPKPLLPSPYYVSKPKQDSARPASTAAKPAGNPPKPVTASPAKAKSDLSSPKPVKPPQPPVKESPKPAPELLATTTQQVNAGDMTATVPAPDRHDAAAVLSSPTDITPPSVDVIAVNLNKMPLQIHDQWVLDRNESQCVLKSTTLKMEDGQGGTRVTLWLSPGDLRINTDSDIDLSYQGTGILLDGDSAFGLESIERGTNLSFVKQRNALLDRMKTAQSLQLTVGFWPSWPVTRTYQVSIPINHFATAMKAWETCNQLISRN